MRVWYEVDKRGEKKKKPKRVGELFEWKLLVNKKGEIL